jgi:hypothetical protein
MKLSDDFRKAVLPKKQKRTLRRIQVLQLALKFEPFQFGIESLETQPSCLSDCAISTMGDESDIVPSISQRAPGRE